MTTTQGSGPHLEELEPPWLALTQAVTAAGAAVARDEEQAGVDVLQLEPVKEGQARGRAAPVQQLAQLIQEWDRTEDLQKSHT